MRALSARPRRSIAELQLGERIEDQIYRVASKDLRTDKNGGLYIHAVLADASGQIPARFWNASQAIFDSIPEGGFLYVRGRVESYKGTRQFIIDGLRAVADGEIDPRDFLPHTRQDIEKMWERVKDILRSIKNPHVLALVARFVRDPEFAAGFKRAPAANKNHHAYIGGLLEHTLNLLEMALLIVPRYPQVSLDLVLAGILLHDAGKVRELAYETNFEYTDEGQLVGHITQAAIWLHEKAGQIATETGAPVPREILNALMHIILSHHGKYEFGSPKLPAIPEAVIVHHLDNLDARVHMMLHEIDHCPDSASDWTTYVRSLETKVYKLDVLGIRTPGPGNPAN
ncbi:MAG: 3'-5' exoribonuclease YhaM family protein, partial [bacterium]